VVIGGFIGGYNETTRQTYALNLTDEKAEWRRMDDMPSSIGITHAAYAVVKNMLYMCGGYVGGNIGDETDICMRYNHTAQIGRQWRLIRPLPEGRAGGGMVYDSKQGVLFFSGGATRSQIGVSVAVDHADSWMYNLSSPLRGWVRSTDMPFFANHMGFTTARDDYNRERHFFVGKLEDCSECPSLRYSHNRKISSHCV
jgi:outer membrane protein assembly factor BamB